MSRKPDETQAVDVPVMSKECGALRREVYSNMWIRLCYFAGALGALIYLVYSGSTEADIKMQDKVHVMDKNQGVLENKVESFSTEQKQMEIRIIKAIKEK